MFRIKSSTSLLASLLIAVSVTTSCGFKPMYAKKDEMKGNTRSCNNFKVNVDHQTAYGISGQSLKYRLQDSLNQICINADKKYNIQLSVQKTKDPVGIQKDTQVTRYNLTINASFNVIDTATGKSVYNGFSTMIGGFDTSVSDYGNYAQEQDTQARLFDELANDISLRIASTLQRK